MILTLLCPNCGGPLPAALANETVTCTFCGETSLIAPDAPETTASGSGTRVAHTAAAATDVSCPRCALALFEGHAHEVRLLGCGQCGGIWLDNASARAAVTSQDNAVTQLAAVAASRASAPAETRAPIGCPSCNSIMGRVQRAGVTIDVCTLHGTWFDRGELGQVLTDMRRANKRAPMRPAAPAIDAPLSPGEIPNFHKGTGLDLEGGAFVAGGLLTAVLGLAALSDD